MTTCACRLVPIGPVFQATANAESMAKKSATVTCYVNSIEIRVAWFTVEQQNFQRRRVNASAADSKSVAHRAPGRRTILSMGPDTDMAAVTTQRPLRTGTDTLATPDSCSATLCAQPRRRTSASVRSVNFTVGSTASLVVASLWASNTLAPEPAVIGNCTPTGTVSRRTAGGSDAATQTREMPSRRYSYTLSPVLSRNVDSTVALAANSGSLTWIASSETAVPSWHRPSSLRAARR